MSCAGPRLLSRGRPISPLLDSAGWILQGVEARGSVRTQQWAESSELRCDGTWRRSSGASVGLQVSTWHLPEQRAHRDKLSPLSSERTIIGSSVKPGASLHEVAVSPDIMIERSSYIARPSLDVSCKGGAPDFAHMRSGCRFARVRGSQSCPPSPATIRIRAWGQTSQEILHGQTSQICPWAQNPLVEIPVLRW